MSRRKQQVCIEGITQNIVPAGVQLYIYLVLVVFSNAKKTPSYQVHSRAGKKKVPGTQRGRSGHNNKRKRGWGNATASLLKLLDMPTYDSWSTWRKNNANVKKRNRRREKINTAVLREVTWVCDTEYPC